MTVKKKTPHLTRERASKLMMKIFGRTGNIKGSADHIPEEWFATFGETKAEIYKTYDKKAIVVVVSFECSELYRLYFDPETLECDYDYAENKRASELRGQMFETASASNYAIVRYEDAVKHNLKIIEE